MTDVIKAENLDPIVLQVYDNRLPPETDAPAFRVDRVVVGGNGVIAFEGLYPDGKPFTVRIRGTDPDGRTVAKLVNALSDRIQEQTGARP